MVRTFRLTVPSARSRFTAQQQLNRKTPNYVDLEDPPPLPDISLELEDLSIRDFRTNPSVFTRSPTPSQRSSVSPSPQRWEYIQHRMMDEGRAIALTRHPRRFLLSVDNDVFKFQEYIPRSATVKTYLVIWDGIGDPLEVMGVDYGSGNPGGTVDFAANRLSTSTFGRYAPDAYVWAVFFLVNPDLNPPDDKWLPTPTNNPDWAALGIGANFPDYPL